jgi:NAD+ synthase (glutamine-hydrolysing)
VLFPELALSGYPPEDLLFHKGMKRQVAAAMERVRSEVKGVTVMVGYPGYTDDTIYNAAALIRDGKLLANYTSRSCRTISFSTRSATSSKGRKAASSS